MDYLESRKPITPGMHAVLDYGTAAGFIGMAFALRGRDDRASLLAAINGVGVLLLALFTDYPGGLFRRIDFKTHRTMDVIQAGMSAAGPALLGFGGEPAARPFYVQTAVEATVIGTTDWEAAA